MNSMPAGLTDLTQIEGMALQTLYLNSSGVSDLSPLRSMPLTSFSCIGTPVANIRSLKGKHLRSLHIQQSKVTDLSSLRDMQVDALTCDFVPERDAAILRPIKTLQWINDMPVAEFWKKYPEAGADRPWKPIFDGRTLDCLVNRGNGAWVVEGGMLANIPGTNRSAQTVQQFADGEVRVRFEITAGDNLYFSIRQGADGVFTAEFVGTHKVAPLAGKVHELVFCCRGDSVSVVLDGDPFALRRSGAPSKGCLQFAATGGVVRIASIDYRELAAAQLDAGALPKELSLDLAPGVKMDFVLVPAGEFDMGDDSFENAKPKHHVKITRPFYMGKYEVTQAQYQKVMGTNPSHIPQSTPQSPVDWVSWDDAQAFCRKMSAVAGKSVKLPTEAQWEYACRAGTATEYNLGQGDQQSLAKAGWYEGNSEKRPRPVGQQAPNAWGLHDMHGNVWEWCEDGWREKYYGQAPAADPVAPATNNGRVARGGSWREEASRCRSAWRGWFPLTDQRNDTGFRVIVVADQAP